MQIAAENIKLRTEAYKIKRQTVVSYRLKQDHSGHQSDSDNTISTSNSSITVILPTVR